MHLIYIYKRHGTGGIRRAEAAGHPVMSAGFTLVEVLMAMIILGVALLAMANMQIMSMRGNRHAMKATEKTTLAQTRVDAIMALPYDDPSLAETVPGAPHSLASISLPAGIAAITWAVDADPSGGQQNSKLITILIRPEDGVALSMTTLKTQAGE